MRLVSKAGYGIVVILGAASVVWAATGSPEQLSGEARIPFAETSGMPGAGERPSVSAGSGEQKIPPPTAVDAAPVTATPALPPKRPDGPLFGLKKDEGGVRRGPLIGIRKDKTNDILMGTSIAAVVIGVATAGFVSPLVTLGIIAVAVFSLAAALMR